MSTNNNGLQGEIKALRQDLLAAVERSTSEVKAEIQGLREELSAVRRGVDLMVETIERDST